VHYYSPDVFVIFLTPILFLNIKLVYGADRRSSNLLCRVMSLQRLTSMLYGEKSVVKTLAIVEATAGGLFINLLTAIAEIAEREWR